MASPSASLRPFLDLTAFPRPLSPRDAARSLMLRLIGLPWAQGSAGLSDLVRHCDWPYFLSLAARHAVAPVLYARLTDGALMSGVPGPAREALARYHATTLARNVLLLSETESFCDRLGRHGIPVMLLKGMALLQGVYPHPALRPMTDVDILVRRRDMAAARRILVSECGYDDAGFETPAAEAVAGRTTLVKRGAPAHLGRMLLEIHWDLVPLEYQWKGRRPPVAQFWTGAQEARTHGLHALTPAGADHLCYVAMHNCVHCFDRLMGLMDAAYLLSRLSASGAWHDLVHRAEGYGCRVDLFLNVALAQALFGAPVPPGALKALAPGAWRARRLAGLFTREALFDEAFSSARRYITRLLAADRPADALRLVAWSLFPPAAWLAQRHDLREMKRVKNRRLAHLLRLMQQAGNVVWKAVRAFGGKREH